MEHLVNEFGGLSQGVVLREKSFCNTPIPISKIYEGQMILLNVIKKINYGSHCDIESVMIEIEKIHYIGSLGAQHILCILTLLRVIYNPYYVRLTIL